MRCDLGQLTRVFAKVLIIIFVISRPCTEAKVFERCELAKLLRNKHGLGLDEVSKWVCIAQHTSSFNTEAYASGLAGGSHGLFQISDVYWCSPPGKGFACNVPCSRLRDADLTDDLKCAHIIHAEHQRLSGDGYNAWQAYAQYCRFSTQSYIAGCFLQSTSNVASKVPNFLQIAAAFKSQHSGAASKALFQHAAASPPTVSQKFPKIYKPCELAQELYYKHKLPMEQIPTWVCIARHESNFDTSAVGRLNVDGSADHGLFQISDLFWCSNQQHGGNKACGLHCNKLLDDDISDDVRCVRRIHSEHTGISGDGFKAWTVYEPYCRNQRYEKVASCFKEQPPHYAKDKTNAAQSIFNQIQNVPTNSFFDSFVGAASNQAVNQQNSHLNNLIHHTAKAPQKGKVYNRCELAQELYFKHKFPMQDIATWVCIAQHESNYDTAAVGRLNGDGSEDHGLFQISDLYWCEHDERGGKACGLPCHKLLDSDLTDDVQCIRTIHAEHTRISGDGYTAWTVYSPHCRNQQVAQIAECFDSNEIEKAQQEGNFQENTNVGTINEPGKRKVYQKCELAQELYFKHKLPMKDIPTWICISQRESNYDTSAVGRLNMDGSADHGLFQISDKFWCSHDKYGGKACNIPCSKLIDDDIADDVRCIKTIHDEHTRISGDGFNAWTVYVPYCLNQQLSQVEACFDSKEIEQAKHEVSTYGVSDVPPIYKPGKRKVYKKCELAQELYFKHKLSMKDIPIWVCIAQYESSYNTAAIGRLNTDGSADHGLFQISDLYWCTHDNDGGKACNIPCSKLIDDDITDDVRCIKTIHDEHTRISGDGFNAWTVYKPHCRNQQLSHIAACFDDKELQKAQNEIAIHKDTNIAPNYKPGKRKVYKKCELAQELYYKHKLPIEDIPTWVCIAQHESSFDTSAVGRLNTDGSADHGLFQISDIYWCTHDSYGGKACNIPCSKLLDDDLTDDIRCIRTIHEEHTRLSGDGFNAWTVYKPHCRNQQLTLLAACFDDKELQKAQNEVTTYKNITVGPTYKPGKRKVYKKCELAQELYFKHKLPIEDIPTWVCIAQYESSFDTSAVGRLNTDGSADHGLFQISDIYWCTHDSYGGKACNIPCSKLLDDDLTDDIRCIRTIHEEHTQLSGDGFNAWTVYKPHCRNQQLEHVSACFDKKILAKVQTENDAQKTDHFSTNHIRATQEESSNNPYDSTPFLNPGVHIKISQISHQTPTAAATKQNVAEYAGNPFFQSSGKGPHFGSTNVIKGNTDAYAENIFLNGLFRAMAKTVPTIKPQMTTLPSAQALKKKYEQNPFLNGAYAAKGIQDTTTRNYKNNPFLQQHYIKHVPTTPNARTTIGSKKPITSPSRSTLVLPTKRPDQPLPPSKNYIETASFRTTPKLIAVRTTTTIRPKGSHKSTAFTIKPYAASATTASKQHTTPYHATTTTRKPTTITTYKTSTTKQRTTTSKPTLLKTTAPHNWSTTQKPTLRSPTASSTRNTAQIKTLTTSKPTTAIITPRAQIATTTRYVKTPTTKKSTTAFYETPATRLKIPKTVTTTTTNRRPTTTQVSARTTTPTTTKKPITTISRLAATTRKSTTTATRKATPTTAKKSTRTTATTRKSTTKATTSRKPATTTTRKPTTIATRLVKTASTIKSTNSHQGTTVTNIRKSTAAPTKGRSTAYSTNPSDGFKISTAIPSERERTITTTTRKPTTVSNRLNSKDLTTATTRRNTITTRNTVTTKRSNYVKLSATTTTTKPRTTTTYRPNSVTTTKYPYVDKNKNKIGYNITRPDPFAHPFFDKYRDRFNFFTTTTPKPKNRTTTDPYYELFRSTSRSIYAYSFGQNLPLQGYNLKIDNFQKPANKSLT